MDLRDFIVTPIVIIIVYTVAFVIRPRVTDEVTRVYFIPALTVKIIGAIAVGLIYWFYYGGGDTFTYHTYGSRFVWEAFMDSPTTGLKLIFTDGSDVTGIYKYSSRIFFFTDSSSYNVVKIAAILDIFTFSTYTSTAILFAVFCFAGMWMFFLTFYGKYPQYHRWLAFASFFIPSVFFWGSGLLKDTLMLGCIGIATFTVSGIFIDKRPTLFRAVLLVFALYGMYAIKIYILLTYLPAVIVWILLSNMAGMKSLILKMMIYPLVLLLSMFLSYYAVLFTSETSEKYSVDNLAKTAQVTAYDIRYYTGKNAGSGYTLGELDGTFGSMVALAPQAINVTLFRPYLWEVSNPFMLLSSFESMGLLMFVCYIVVKRNVRVIPTLTQPDIFFCLVFSITFAFAVGVSTFNFGSLVRYKIPLLPFFLISLLLIFHYSNSDTKLEEFDMTE